MQESIPVQSLHIGMFVADLDRPWLDTALLTPGFLIESPEQITQLREFCEFVVVDWMRSAGEYAPRALANGEIVSRIPWPSAPRSSRPHTVAEEASVRADLPPPQAVSLWESLRSLMWRRPRQIEKPHDENAGGEVIQFASQKSFLPHHVPITYYAATCSVGEELPRAETVDARTGVVFQQLAHDILADKEIRLDALEEVVGAMADSAVRNPDALMRVAGLREHDTAIYPHGLSVAVHLLAFGRHLGFPRGYLVRLGMVGLLLDVGMLKVPEAILNKKVILSSDEFAAVKLHVAHGMTILRAMPGLHPDVAEGIAQHHERENGSGYPAGLPSERIGTFGRMAAIVDTFTAMTARRTYREPAAAFEVLRALSGWAGTSFNAPMVEQFIQSIGVFPAGSLVELSTGEVAMVVSHNKAHRLKPRVLIIMAPDKSPTAHPINLDLMHQAVVAGNDPVHVVRGLPVGAYGANAQKDRLG